MNAEAAWMQEATMSMYLLRKQVLGVLSYAAFLWTSWETSFGTRTVPFCQSP